MRWLSFFEEVAKLEGYKKPKYYKGKLKLDTNENIAIPRSFLANIMKKVKVDVREYPSNYDELRKALARYLRVKKDCIAIGNGSDQIIDLILSIFADKNVSSVTIKPTFSFYVARCKLHAIDINEIQLDGELRFDIDEMIKSNADICYLCSPNNPTGNQFARDDVISILESFDGLMIIDEAYAEFARYSLKDIVNRYNNLIVLRTMSKTFGLAGLRLGYIISNPALISIFDKIQYPYPVSSVAVNAALLMLEQKDRVFAIIDKIKKERDRVYEVINSLGLHAYRSDANFVMFEANEKIFKGLLREDIVIKDLGMINKKHCYRVSIGNKQINDKFINALRNVCL